MLRASTTQKQSSLGLRLRGPLQISRRPPLLTGHRPHPGITLAVRAQLQPTWPVDRLGKPGSRARLPSLWAWSLGGSLETPDMRLLPQAFREGSSTRTSPPWGASPQRTLRRPGRPRPAPRASPTSRWCVPEGQVEWDWGGRCSRWCWCQSFLWGRSLMPWSGVLGDTEASSGWSILPGGAAAFGGGAEQWGAARTAAGSSRPVRRFRAVSLLAPSSSASTLGSGRCRLHGLGGWPTSEVRWLCAPWPPRLPWAIRSATTGPAWRWERVGTRGVPGRPLVPDSDAPDPSPRGMVR